MKVRVKEEMSCFVGGSLRTSGEEFTLKPVTCSVEKDKSGEFRVISVDEQFTESCMICLEKKEEPKPKGKPGPKPKAEKKDPEQED